MNKQSISIKRGFPPKAIDLTCGKKLNELGIQNKETLIVAGDLASSQ